MRFSPFERAAEFGSRGSPVVDSGLYTGTTRDAFEDRRRAPGKDASRGVPVLSPDSIAGDPVSYTHLTLPTKA